LFVVIDTNVLLVSVSDRSKYHWLYRCIIDKRISIAFTNDILAEYEEQIGLHWHPSVASNVVRALLELTNVHKIDVYFHWNLIYNDEDDNKFVDCAFASNADYIVTNDSDFNVLKQVEFPSVNVISLNGFRDLLIEQELI
jgi:putative PIN family toxin of toxin-antitoxin system